MNEVYACPRCGQDGKIVAINPLFDDVRFDTVTCSCGAIWRVYYKFTNPKVETMSMPSNFVQEETIVEG